MKRDGFFSLTIIGAGLLYLLVPEIFHVCPVNNGKVMKCFWTARAELGLGVAVMVGGFLYFLAKSERQKLGQCQMLAVLAALGGCIPSFLIGVCADEAMLCRAGALPAWMIVSGFLLLVCVINVWRLSRRIGRDTAEAANG